MSQERTRFPIQPEERRRSALSSRNVKAVPDEAARANRPAKRGKQPDKPDVPPHERHQRRQAHEHGRDGGEHDGAEDRDAPPDQE